MHYKIDAAFDRNVLVSHNGHRWHFRFSEGWCGGDVPQIGAPVWKDGKQPDDPFMTDSAATEAIAEARRQGWLSSRRP
jgi:hypothetical protein